MSYTSFNRIRAGIESPTHTISAPVVPQAIDLRMLQSGKRGGGGLAVPGNGPVGPGVGGEAFDALIGGAQKQAQASQAKRDAKRKAKQDAMEQGRQAHQDATLKSYTDAAESTASQPSGRHVYDLPNGRTAASTRDTRGAADVWGNTVASGPLGSFGEPAGSSLPETFDTIGGAFSGAGF